MKTLFLVFVSLLPDAPLVAQDKPAPAPVENAAREPISAKLDRIVIPRMEMRDATLEDAVAWLQRKSAQLDTTEPAPVWKGVKIFLQTPASNPDARLHKVNLTLTNITLATALRAVAESVGAKITINGYSVIISFE